MSFSPRIIKSQNSRVKSMTARSAGSEATLSLTHGGFVIYSSRQRNEWGAKSALQIDFELKKLPKTTGRCYLFPPKNLTYRYSHST
jgi:hypothetical protein